MKLRSDIQKGKRKQNHAQIHTLEAFSAFLIVILAATISVQTISVGHGTEGGETILQNEKLAQDILAQSTASGELKTAILNWSGEDVGFNGSVDGNIYYTSEGNDVPGEFGNSLSVLDSIGVSYDIYLVCDGDRHPFVKNGGAGPESATESVFVTLTDGDRTGGGTHLENTPSYPCRDSGEDSHFYNTVEVRATVWSK